MAPRDAPPDQRRATRERLEGLLARACQPFTDRTVPQRTLRRRIIKRLHELFTFVVHPEVPSTTNEAERDLRTLVIARKISGGTRSPPVDAGRRATLFSTWRVQGLNPFAEYRALPRVFRPQCTPACSGSSSPGARDRGKPPSPPRWPALSAVPTWSSTG